ncbi:LuxR family transcriptional regulator [Mesorhizobium sp.]|uniref:LuxR family transcriptional regulator n=1 Tax=Mesorhizobium sp. TaxID=1871066 RepID=UPI0025BA55D6|nr:LuxR family transcriptional regulator [Mesorhizobium sp.]
MSDQFSLISSIHFPKAAEAPFAVELGQFLTLADGVAQTERLFDLLATFAMNFDCPWIAYGSLTPDHTLSKSVRCDPPVLLNYPDEWQKRCFKMGYERIDPIIKTSRKRAGAFRWSDVYKDATTTEDERRVFDEAATFGLRTGIGVPLHGPHGSFAIMSFAQPRDREIQNNTVIYLQLAALYFHLKVYRLENSSGVWEVPRLSLRETECISWAARGKTSWEIGKILGISNNTVNFHIKNVKTKLNAASRTVAATKAVDIGIINL